MINSSAAVSVSWIRTSTTTVAWRWKGARERQMSGCHYTGCVDLNIPCSLVHLSFCGSDLRAAIACFKVPKGWKKDQTGACRPLAFCLHIM